MNENTEKIKSLIGQTFNKVEKESDANGYLYLSNGSKIYISYWRYCLPNKSKFSSFDDKQKYGLTAPMDCLNLLKEAILNVEITSIKLTDSFFDIEIIFANNSVLQIFNFTGNEVWEITFSDGTSVLSNYC